MALQVAPGGLHCEIPVSEGVFAGISLAAAGDMALSKDKDLPNRKQLLDKIGIPRDRLFGLRQIHSRRIQRIEKQRPSEVVAVEADGLLTDRPDAVLSVTVADCLPIFLVDRVSGAFCLVHSGWRGTGIVQQALALMSSTFGSRSADIAVVIGPGIGTCCYVVTEQRAALFRAEYGADTVITDKDGTPRLDLRRANLHLLKNAGVEQISVVSDCTACSNNLGSFRRQGPTHYTLMLAWMGRNGLP
jgi:hypothetical protein